MTNYLRFSPSSKISNILINQKPSRFILDNLSLSLSAENLSSYPRLGSIWYDLSGKGNNGLFVGNTAYSANNGGIMTFDGNGDYLVIDDNSTLELGSNQMSIEVWVNFSALKGYQNILSKPGASDYFGWVLYLESNNTLNFLTGNGSWTVVLSTGVVPSTNTWYHIVVTRNSSNVWTYYLNNVSRATTTNSFSIPDLSFPMYIARYPNFPSANLAQTLSGSIGEVRVYNGYCLTSTDVSTHFNSQRTRYGV